MTTVLINGVEYIKKPAPIKPPTNNIGATHWAVCPDGDIIFYKITNTILLYGQISRMWLTPTYEAIPYTLYCFDDYDV